MNCRDICSSRLISNAHLGGLIGVEENAPKERRAKAGGVHPLQYKIDVFLIAESDKISLPCLFYGNDVVHTHEGDDVYFGLKKIVETTTASTSYPFTIPTSSLCLLPLHEWVDKLWE